MGLKSTDIVVSYSGLSTISICIRYTCIVFQLYDGYSATFMGPCSFDVGVLLADYISLYHEHMLTEQDNDNHRRVAYKMVDACQDTGISWLFLSDIEPVL